MVQPVTFLGADTQPPAEPGAGSRARGRRVVLAAGAAWLVSAALCGLAGTADLFTFHYLDAFSARGGYDASGRPIQSGLPGDRGPRWSLALWVLALAFVALGVLTLRAAELGSIGTALRTTGVIAAAVLVGIAVGIVLFIEASLSTSTAVADLYQEQVDLRIGACVWLVLAAVLCSVAAVLATSGLRFARITRLAPRIRRRPSSTPPAAAEDGDAAEILTTRRHTRGPDTPPSPPVFDL